MIIHRTPVASRVIDMITRTIFYESREVMIRLYSGPTSKAPTSKGRGREEERRAPKTPPLPVIVYVYAF